MKIDDIVAGMNYKHFISCLIDQIQAWFSAFFLFFLGASSSIQDFKHEEKIRLIIK